MQLSSKNRLEIIEDLSLAIMKLTQDDPDYPLEEFVKYCKKVCDMYSKITGKWSIDKLIAYDSFLYSEELRHQDDIKMIQEKRNKLHEKGYIASEPGPWLNIIDIKSVEEEIKNAG